MEILEKLLKIFANVVRHHPRPARWLVRTLLVILIVALAVNFAYYILLCNRDDVYTTRLIPNTSLAITAPTVVYAGGKVYQFFLSLAPPPSITSQISTANTVPTSVSPTGILSPTITAPAPTQGATGPVTSTNASGAGTAIPTKVRIVAAQRIVLLPQQTMVFTFTPGVYQSYVFSYTNSFSEQSAGDASVKIEVDDSLTADVPINQEGAIWAFLRQLFINNLGAVLFTSIIPSVLVVIAFIYDQLEQEKSEMYQYRMDYMAQHCGDDIRDDYFMSSLEIFNREIERLPDNLRKQFDEVRFQLVVRDIKESILKGDIDEGKRKYKFSTPQLLTGSLSNEQKKTLDDLISDEVDVHLKYIKDSGELSDAHLSWLLYKKSEVLSLNILQDVLARHEDRKFILEKSLHEKIVRMFRVRSIQLPPSQEKEYIVGNVHKNGFAHRFFYNRLKAKDYNKFFEVLDDFVDKLKLDSGNQIVVVTGLSGSGKHQLLRRFIQNEKFEKVFYIWLSLPVTQSNIHIVIRHIQEMMLQELFVLLVDNPYLWDSVEVDIQKMLGEVIARRPYLFECDPVNYLKSRPMTKSMILYEDDRRSFIEWLQKCYKEAFNENKRDRQIELFISDIGRAIEIFKFSGVCFCIENVNHEFDAVQLLRVLNGYLKQDVFLRLVYNNTPAILIETVFWVDVVFKSEWFKRDAWIGYLPKFESEAVSEQFKQHITVLSDLEPWLVLLRDYPLVTEARWKEVCGAMVLARQERDPVANNWIMADCKRALELLGV